MVLKIYFDDKPVFLCDEINDVIENYRHHPDTVFIDEMTNPAINSLLHEIVKPGFHAGIIFTADIKQSQKLLWRHFKIIQAAGGLVENEKKEILMIFRRGKWDLPKGKLDKGETLENCAAREVKEETGLETVKLGSFLLSTYHTYSEFGKHILKESYWYSMKAPSSQILKPQTEEDIHGIEWVKTTGIPEKLQNSFPLISDIIDAGMRIQ